MNLTRSVFIVPFSILVLSCMTNGCAGKIFKDKPPSVVIQVTASSDLNPDIQERPSPIVLRIYTLKSDDIFKNAGFFALYEQDANILGGDLISREELEISPGEIRTLEKRELPMGPHFIGVLAAYRDLDNAVWRGTIATPADKTTNISITLEKLTLTVTSGKK
ncbi:MAG: type VI secretion system lipoprotein TssJ [Gammaproteobacteria bacterium]